MLHMLKCFAGGVLAAARYIFCLFCVFCFLLVTVFVSVVFFSRFSENKRF